MSEVMLPPLLFWEHQKFSLFSGILAHINNAEVIWELVHLSNVTFHVQYYQNWDLRQKKKILQHWKLLIIYMSIKDPGLFLDMWMTK